jgi:erythromycin esterase
MFEGYDRHHLMENAGPLGDKVSRKATDLVDVEDLDPLMERIGDARYVLLGEASHGTADFYIWRSLLSRRLIREKGFSFIAVEGDWPDCYRVNRYIKGYQGSVESAYGVLHTFERWPTWMWANWEIVALVDWLRRHNDGRDSQAGFYGLDVYSLWESMHSIISYLDRTDPEAAMVARRAYSCFEPFGQDVQEYALNASLVPRTCEREVVALLAEMRGRSPVYDHDREAAFCAEQNALVLVDAERYYRAMVRGGPSSWNIRDMHMADTLDRLVRFHGPCSKAIVWAHNTHVGDARATDMIRAGEFNIGQLVRQRHGDEGVVLVGFSSNSGSVIAGSRWDAPMARMKVPRGMPGSWEDVLHLAGQKRDTRDMLLLLDDVRDEPSWTETRGHRAIGVVYQPEFERYGNYIPTELPERYDALLYIDESTAVHPLHIRPDLKQPPDLYPWGI